MTVDAAAAKELDLGGGTSTVIPATGPLYQSTAQSFDSMNGSRGCGSTGNPTKNGWYKRSAHD